LAPPAGRRLQSKRFVFEMAFAFERLGVFVLAENVFVELHVGAKKIPEPRFDSLPILQHFLGDEIRIDVDTDRAHDSEFFSFDWDRRALELSRADVQLIIQFVFIKELPTLQIDQQVSSTGS
jgi:hypothetical protein